MTEENPAKKDTLSDSLIIRAWPKVIFLYPTFLAALIAGIWTRTAMDGSETAVSILPATPGRIFWWVLMVNILILAFDFTRGEFIALILAFGVVTLGIILLNQQWEFVRPVATMLDHIRLVAHPHFYMMIAVGLGLMFLAVFIQTRWDYWELTHNELLHHNGLWGTVQRYPAPQLRMTKDIVDLFEFALWGSGRLVLKPRGEHRDIVLDNVLFINSIEDRIQEKLSTLQVRINADED